MTRFIGLDPGKVSGLVSFAVHDDQISQINHYQLDPINTIQYFDQMKDHILTSGETDIIVCVESFIITPQTGKNSQAPWSLEVIGGTRYFVETAGLSLRMSAPSAHKKLCTDVVLKKAGLYFPGQGHATDAARVALLVAIADHKLLTWALREG